MIGRKNKAIVIAVAISIVLSLFIFLGHFYPKKVIAETIQQNYIETTKNLVVNITTSELETVLRIINETVGDKTWIRYEAGKERYDCNDFAHDSIVALRKNGYSEETAFALCDDVNGHGLSHKWVGIIVDGEVISIEPNPHYFSYSDYPTVVEREGRRCIARGLY